MVRTRSKSMFIERQNHQDLFDAIVEKARNRRPIDAHRSPRKQIISKQQRKAKRNSMTFERILLEMKENLSKVSDRNLPDRPPEQSSIADQIHEAIKSGVAKRNLRPVLAPVPVQVAPVPVLVNDEVIVIDDDDD